MVAKSISEQVDGKHPHGRGSLEWRKQGNEAVGNLDLVEDVPEVGELVGKKQCLPTPPYLQSLPTENLAAPLREGPSPPTRQRVQIQSNAGVPTEPSIPHPLVNCGCSHDLKRRGWGFGEPFL